MKIKVVIPAKGQSVRVPMKNLRPFYEEKSLLAILLEKLRPFNLPVVVNSESAEVLELAEHMGAMGQLRPDTLSQPETTPRQLAHYLADVNQDAEYILYAHCTNPLISADVLKTMLALPPENWKGYDSLNSAYFVQKHVWNEREALYDTTDRPPTQKIQNLRALEYSFNLISREKMLSRSDFIGENPAFVMVPYDQVIDIDEEIDFQIAQEIYARRHGSNQPTSAL